MLSLLLAPLSLFLIRQTSFPSRGDGVCVCVLFVLRILFLKRVRKTNLRNRLSYFFSVVVVVVADAV